LIQQVPCLVDVPDGASSSFLVSLMKTYSATHHPENLASDEFDANKFICYVASHTEEFGKELEFVIQHCPQLMALPFSCEEPTFLP